MYVITIKGFYWDDEDDDDGNVKHIIQKHSVHPREVEQVFKRDERHLRREETIEGARHKNRGADDGHLRELFRLRALLLNWMLTGVYFRRYDLRYAHDRQTEAA